MNRRETRDRACKKCPKDSGGIDSSTDGSRSCILPDKEKITKKVDSNPVSLNTGLIPSDSSVESTTPRVFHSDQLLDNCYILSPSSLEMEGDNENESASLLDSGRNAFSHACLGGVDDHEQVGTVPDEASAGENAFMKTFMQMMGKMVMREMEPTPGARHGSSSSAEVELNRKINAMAPHKEGTDIAKYIKKLEDDLTDINCPRARFKTVLLQKLQSETAADYIASINRSDFTYSELKTALISTLGSSKLSLGVKLADFVSDNRSADSLKAYSKIKSLVDSIDMATTDKSDLLLFIATSAFRASRSYNQRSLMDARVIKSFKDLSEVASSLKASESDRHSNRYPPNVAGNFQKPTYPCHICKKFGHRTVDCHYRNSPSNDQSSASLNPSKSQGIVCFTCNAPGHKSPDCPTKKGGSSDSKQNVVKRGPRTYSTNWVAGQSGAPHVMGKVNGMPCRIVPDTGAEITIVPAAFVHESQLLDEFVNVRGWNCEPKLLQTAKVDFEYGDKSFVSIVAVAHEDDRCNRVLFSVPMDGDMASRLLLDAASNALSKVNEAGHPGDAPGVQMSAESSTGSVTTPKEACKTSQGSGDIQGSMTVSVVTRSEAKRKRVRKRNKHVNDIVDADSFVSECERLANIDLGIVQSAAEVADRTASVSEQDSSGSGLGVVSEVSMDVEQNGHISHNINPEVVAQPVESSGGSSVGGMNVTQPTAQDGDDNDNPDVVSFDVPDCKDNSSIDSLIREVETDDSLLSVRTLADKNLNGYSFNEKGVLIHSTVDELTNTHDRIVLPQSKRHKALVLAHDKTAHVGVRGMRKLLSSRFVWPGIHGDIVSCDMCLRVNFSGNKKALMVQRPVLTQPFESVAVDLYGPLPKGKRGSRYLFTYICLSSRWPEALPMRTASAQEAAQCFVQIIARTGIPLKILSDRGTIFLSKLMENLCTLLGIDAIQSSPYRPQTNGVVERLHGTLKPMLAKAIEGGID